MKLFFLASFLLFNTLTSFAQVKMISPLPCNTWGKDKFLSYAEIDGKMPKQKEHTTYKYMAVNNPSEEAYNSYTTSRRIYSWNKEREYEYINNIQVIRWDIQDDRKQYNIRVTNVYDDILYEIACDNACGVIIFPDSVVTDYDIKYPVIRINEKPADYSSPAMSIDGIFLKASPERAPILLKIQACSSLECKIEILKSHNKTLDILSLLELEKLSAPQNTEIDKLYWKFVSGIKYNFCGQSEER